MEKDRGKQPKEGDDDSGSKRKLEGGNELANPRAQEMAGPRPRLASYTPLPYFPVPTPNPVSYAGLPCSNASTLKMVSIPERMVSAVIGREGERIRFLQLRSGTRIEVTQQRNAGCRAVELTGTPNKIYTAEQLMKDLIAQEESRLSDSSGNQQMRMTVPNNKVGLVIGRSGENVRNIRNQTRARVQIPPYPAPGDPPTERTIYINGLQEQNEAARELVNDIVRASPSTSVYYTPPIYASASNWAQQPPIRQPFQYGYYPQPGPRFYSCYPGQMPVLDQASASTSSQTSRPPAGYLSYGQQLRAGTMPIQTGPAYAPAAYSERTATPQVYPSSSGYSSRPPAQTGHGQAGYYSQTSYRQVHAAAQVSHASALSGYGHGRHVGPTANYPPSTYPGSSGQPLPRTQPPSQPTSTEPSQSRQHAAGSQEKNSNKSPQN